MSLKTRIADDTKAALLGGDRFVGETLRGLKAAILNEEVAAGKRESGLDDAQIEQVVAKELKKRQESAKLYRDNNRPELAEPEEKEAEVLAKYLPEQISDSQLNEIVLEKITHLNATNMQMMGQVIGAVKAEVGNTCDGAKIAAAVKRALQS